MEDAGFSIKATIKAPVKEKLVTNNHGRKVSLSNLFLKRIMLSKKTPSTAKRREIKVSDVI